MLKFFNSLTRKVEEFKEIDPPNVGMYTCGPTVHDHMHIGNLRTFTFSDILYRTLIANGYKVKMVMNITDIEDKIIKKAREKNISINDLTKEYTQIFFDDLKALNILPADVYPKATEHIGKMIKYIEKLLDKELAYLKEGSVYFDISKFKNYGKLSAVELEKLKTGTRVLSDEYTKDNVADFALWKSVKPREFGCSSPWGKGRPGWHIECSVMSQEYLGETFDIHLGGVDLLFPHHENEIAQSEGYTSKKFVNYFIHGEHILVDGQKMSKSKKNFYTLADLKRKGFDPLSLRYLFLTAHYRDKINFTWKSLEAAQNALNNLWEEIRNWDSPQIGCAQYEENFLASLNNDLATPQALAVLWELVKSDYPTSTKAASLLKMDQVLGLGLDQYLGKRTEIPEKIQEKVEQRERMRKSGDFKESDKLRREIKKLGFEIEDTPIGPKIKSS